jgi:L-ascorbate metabolism protein UlaG (beta-lactamase superfamily)
VTTRPPSRRITTAAHYAHSPQFGDGAFRNPVRRPAMGLRKTLRILVDALWNKPADAVPPVAPPVLALTAAQLAAAPDHSLFRLGHSSLLVKLRGVLLSHDHYDHLDRDAIRQLADKAEHFLAPLGVGDRLVAWGVDPARVRQFDWWEGTVIDGVQFIATPAQHFSGRGMFDGDSTLWASWTILDERPGEPGLRLFFSGDSGYFDGFAEIGRRYGPFDVTLVETGAYDAHWPLVHMQPEQTVQAHVDLRGRWLVPIHNGTFDLAMHPWTEPFERVSALAAARGIALATPRMGERFDLSAPQPTAPWWRAVE